MPVSDAWFQLPENESARYNALILHWLFICILETLKIFNCNSDVHFIIDFSGYLTLGAQF